MHWPERGQIYFYASSPDAAAWMLKFVFVYLANTAVLCYSLTIICCCHVQDYIYWIIFTKNDHRHTYQAKSLPLQREFGRVALPWVLSNGPTDPLHISCICSIWKILLLFIFLSESVKVRFLPRIDTFSFAQEPHVVYCF
jgi:uncharacterized membrane protein (GlpM family)